MCCCAAEAEAGDASDLLKPDQWAALRDEIAAIGLPDLDAWLREHQAARRAVQRDELEAARAVTGTAHEAVARLTEQSGGTSATPAPCARSTGGIRACSNG